VQILAAGEALLLLSAGIFIFIFSFCGRSKYGTDIRMRLITRWSSKPSKVSFELGRHGEQA